MKGIYVLCIIYDEVSGNYVYPLFLLMKRGCIVYVCSVWVLLCEWEFMYINYVVEKNVR